MESCLQLILLEYSKQAQGLVCILRSDKAYCLHYDGINEYSHSVCGTGVQYTGEFVLGVGDYDRKHVSVNTFLHA